MICGKKYLLLINFGELGHYGSVRKNIQQNKDLWDFSLFMGLGIFILELFSQINFSYLSKFSIFI